MIPTQEEFRSALEARHGRELQARFAKASVAVCGLGGLGSNIAIVLARAGVGELHLLDFDRVDLPNLNRQQYAVSQIGRYKTDAMQETLLYIAPHCHVIADTVRLTAENAAQYLKRADIVCEAFDQPETKAMLVNTVLEQCPKAFVVSASGMSGLHTGNTIRTRRVARQLYLCGDGESDVETDRTLFAPRVMLCAAHQANTVLRIIAEKFDV